MFKLRPDRRMGVSHAKDEGLNGGRCSENRERKKKVFERSK